MILPKDLNIAFFSRRLSRVFSLTGWAWGCLAFQLAVFGWSACSAPPPGGRRSFVGAGEEPSAAQPEGLNPLGSLETCAQVKGVLAKGPRVVISRPESFTRDASIMIVALQEALSKKSQENHPVEMVLSDQSLLNTGQAIDEGQRCQATIVLWERHGSRTLELTLPYPAQIPLRSMVQEKLCEFGDHSEQVTILYLTILGLSAVFANDYDQANTHFQMANRIDDRCFQLPLTPRSPSPGRTPRSESLK